MLPSVSLDPENIQKFPITDPKQESQVRWIIALCAGHVPSIGKAPVQNVPRPKPGGSN